MIEDGTSGILVPDGDREGLARAMLRLFEDWEQAVAMSKAAWQRAFTFDAEHMMRRWAGAFAVAIEQREVMVDLTDARALTESLERRGDDLHLRVGLQLELGAPAPAGSGSPRITWLLVARDSAEQVRVPARVEARREDRERPSFEVSGVIDLAAMGEHLADPEETLDLWLDVVWNNAHWRGRVPGLDTGRAVVHYETAHGNVSIRRSPHHA